MPRGVLADDVALELPVLMQPAPALDQPLAAVARDLLRFGGALGLQRLLFARLRPQCHGEAATRIKAKVVNEEAKVRLGPLLNSVRAIVQSWWRDPLVRVRATATDTVGGPRATSGALARTSLRTQSSRAGTGRTRP
jgi:hypothetical protein